MELICGLSWLMCSVWQLIFIIFCCMHINSCRASRIWEAAIIIANDTIDHELVHETVHIITVFWEHFWPVTIHAWTSTACTGDICACAPSIWAWPNNNNLYYYGYRLEKTEALSWKKFQDPVGIWTRDLLISSQTLENRDT